MLYKGREIRSVCPRISSAVLILLALILAGGPKDTAARQPNIDRRGRPLYFSDVLTIMLKEGIDPILVQDRAVTMGTASLDALVAEHGILSIQPRFKHRPIPENSALPDLSRLYRLAFPEGRDIWDIVEAFAGDPGVEFAEPIPIAYLADVPDDDLYDQLQHLPQIMAAEAWDEHHGEDGAPVVIGIVDSGVDYNHPDLTDNMWQNLAEDADGDGHTLEFNFDGWELDPGDLNGLDDDANGYVDDLIGWDFYDIATSQDNDPVDALGHGTHCSGIAAAVTNNAIGIASISWNLRFMIVKGFDWDDGESGYDTYNAVIYAAENNADIISNSWGVQLYSQADQMAIEYSAGLGSIIVAAGHNYQTDEYFFPSSYPQVISVAAVAVTDAKAWYSNYGVAIDVSAPGGDLEIDGGIISCVMGGGYEGWSGTSMATPMVAGLLGLVKSYHPDWTNEQITIQVLGTADDIDDVNPEYENMLGTGRINAQRAMTETEVSVPQQLRVDLIETRVTDAGGDGLLDPGEVVDLDFTLRNFTHYVGTENATLTLVSEDPEVIVLSDTYACSVPADDYFDIDSVFQIQVATDATPHVTTLSLHLDADLEVLFGSDTEIELLVAPSGVFVYEGVADGIDYSGGYLRDLLQEMGLPVVYADFIPPYLSVFDAVFMSCGNFGPRLKYGTYPSDEETAIIIDYLQNGGRMYIESGSFIGAYEYYGHPDVDLIMELVGVNDHGNNTTDFIGALVGQTGTLAEGISFTESEQEHCSYIDHFVPDASAALVFVEDNDSPVAIQNIGSNGQRTVLFSYSLSDLVDVGPISNRSNLVLRIAEFLELELPAGYLVADFMGNVSAGPAPLTVQFTDLSHTDPATPITSWEWDFGNDGSIDATEQYPQWTFTEPGYHQVRLVVGNAARTSTLVRDDGVLVNDGVLVWDAAPGERDYSGGFIYDELISLGYPDDGTPVIYASGFPRSLVGFDAVFLSFGNVASNKGILSDYRSTLLLQYLQTGGRIYLEGGDPLGRDQPTNTELLTAFGLDNVYGGYNRNSVELIGQAGSLAEGIDFSATDQIGLDNVDYFAPAATAVPVFDEVDYFTVAVQNEGDQGQKTVCFAYALAELVDGDPPSTRQSLLSRIMAFFDLSTTSVESESTVPAAVRLVGNHPNPFNPQTVIAFEIPREQEVTVAVYDLIGRRIRILASGICQAGRQQVSWNGRDANDCEVASGTYLVRLSTDSGVEARKVMLLR